MKENHTEDSDQNVKSHEERKYQFIKEQIRPQGREKIRKIVRRIALFCGILILFAVISMSSFYIMRKYMPVEALDTEIIYVTPAPSDQEPDSTEAAARETDPAQKSDRSQLSSLEQYDHLTQQLIDNGNAAKSSLVQLRKDSEQMLSTEASWRHSMMSSSWTWPTMKQKDRFCMAKHRRSLETAWTMFSTNFGP